MRDNLLMRRDGRLLKTQNITKQQPQVLIRILIPFLHGFHHRVRLFRLAFPTFFSAALVGKIVITISAIFRFRTWAVGR